MISISEIKRSCLDTNVASEICTSRNELGQPVVVEKRFGYLKLSTFQSNGWTRINISEYDFENRIWIEEEFYEK